MIAHLENLLIIVGRTNQEILDDAVIDEEDTAEGETTEQEDTTEDSAGESDG